MENTFLPSTYEPPATESKYLKIEQGKTKFRILSNSIQGWVDWQEKDGKRKPIRTREWQPAIDPERPSKHFWAFAVWDYAAQSVKVMEITQKTIQQAILELYKSEDWGDPKGYDIEITREGEKMETKYHVIPKPPKPLDTVVAEARDSMNVDLEQLFVGGDPFGEASHNAPVSPYNAPGRTEEPLPEESVTVAGIPF